jgi:hypothetical protein
LMVLAIILSLILKFVILAPNKSDSTLITTTTTLSTSTTARKSGKLEG